MDSSTHNTKALTRANPNGKLNDPSIEEFPITPEQFDFTKILSNTMTRVNTVKWFQGMFDTFVALDHPDRELLSVYLTTMTSSLENTTYLYKIQISNNMKFQQLPVVAKDNMFYPKLLQSHQLWTILGIEIRAILQSTDLYSNYEYLFNIFEKPDEEMGSNLMRIIASNDNLPVMLKKLEDNSQEINIHIQEYKANEG